MINLIIVILSNICTLVLWHCSTFSVIIKSEIIIINRDDCTTWARAAFFIIVDLCWLVVSLFLTFGNYSQPFGIDADAHWKDFIVYIFLSKTDAIKSLSGYFGLLMQFQRYLLAPQKTRLTSSVNLYTTLGAFVVTSQSNVIRQVFRVHDCFVTRMTMT